MFSGGITRNQSDEIRKELGRNLFSPTNDQRSHHIKSRFW